MTRASFRRERDEEWLRGRFAEPRSFAPVTTGDGLLFREAESLRSAAVLVPVVSHRGDLTVLFTRRTDHLHDHAGQISFPGGRAEPHEESAAETALRETEEEIGLAADRVEILGSLSEYVTVTGYRVTPVVGLVRPPLELKPDEFEVAEIFEVPLGFLLDPANHQRNSVVHLGRQRHYYALPYGQYYIWGATAGMLMNFYSYLTS
jgi:8-oxo-dGTP pyrophosphatase MutT (NUDIX family)